MKKIYHILSLLTILLLSACQSEELSENPTGYLRLNIGAGTGYNSRSEIPADYNPKQIAVQIIDASQQVIQQTEDWELWKDKPLELKAGTYTIKASSNGFDGMASGFEIPYYVGSEQVIIENKKETQAKVICSLANVKVTVKMDPVFVSKFKQVTVQVGDKDKKYTPLNFSSSEKRSAYFPVTSLYAELTAINMAGVSHSMKQEFTTVKAKDHYILNYKLADSGKGNITVTVDPTTKEYNYTFNVGTESSNQATLTANAWSKFTIVRASNITTSSGVTIDPAQVKFCYKAKSAEEWQNIAGTQDGENYTAQITGLTPSTEYEYKMTCGEVFESTVASFTTEKEEALYNGNFDSWYKRDKTWYAVAEGDFSNGSFWDSSNPGTTTGAGALVNVNPTQGNSTIVHTAGGKSAELKSQYASAFGIGKFAAASLYSGTFGGLVGTSGAKINFGQPFASRPTQLHGWFQYKGVKIDYVGGNQPANTVQKGDDDICAIYIALSNKRYTVDNTNTSTFIDFKNDPNIIAYGELPADQCVNTGDVWKEFTIDVKYKTMDKPSDMYIIIVASSSKYGDYFTGGNGSIMYLDDFELIYGDTPVMWE